jgi:hypothetical protein
MPSQAVVHAYRVAHTASCCDAHRFEEESSREGAPGPLTDFHEPLQSNSDTGMATTTGTKIQLPILRPVSAGFFARFENISFVTVRMFGLVQIPEPP